MAARGAPDQAYLAQSLARAKTKFQRRNQKIEDIRKRRWNETEVDIPDNFKKITKSYHAPLVRDLIRRSQAILSSALPTPSVKPIDPSSPKSVENASRREKWLVAAYRKLNRRRNWFGQITDAFPADGYAVWKLVLKMDRYGSPKGEDEEDETYLKRQDKEKKLNWPFVAEHVDTCAYFPLSEDADGVCEVIEYSRREAYPLLTKYKDKLKDHPDLGPSLSNPEFDYSDCPDTVEFVEYWNRTHYAYMIDGHKVEEKEHNYGRPPYFCALFSPTSSKDPEFETEGIADPLVALQDKVEEMRTMQMNWAFLSAFPVARMKPATDDAIEIDPQTTEVVWEPGSTMNPIGGNVWEWVQAPTVGGDITSLGNYYEQMADKISLAPILYGQITGDISGPAAQSLIALARAVFGPGLSALAQQFDEMAEFIQHLIQDVVKEDVPVWSEGEGSWLELGPDDVNDYFEVMHNMEPITELERMSKAIWLADAQARGAISMRHYREEGLGIHDPESMDREVRIEKMRDSDSYAMMVFARFEERVNGPPPPQDPMAGAIPPGTPPALPVGPGGPGMPQVAGVQQGMMPGMGGPMGDPAMMPQPGPPMGPPMGGMPPGMI